MTVPTITSGTPPDKVARLIKNFDELIVEGDDNFQRTVLENFYGATLRVPRSRAYLWFGSAIICVIAAALHWIFALPSSSQLPHFNEVGKTIEKGAHDVGKTVEKSAENISSGLDRDLVATVVWPVVAIIVAVLVYLVIRKAIEGGNTVEISWKVTEKAYGRIVVRKVVRLSALDAAPSSGTYRGCPSSASSAGSQQRIRTYARHYLSGNSRNRLMRGMPEELPAGAGGRENMLVTMSSKGLSEAPIRNKNRYG